MANIRRTPFTFEDKLKIIREIELGTPQVSVCRSYNVKHQTVSHIWKHRDRIQKDSIHCNKRRRLRPSLHKKLNKLLLSWYQQAKKNNEKVNGTILENKAVEIGKLVGEDLKCPSSWINRFKQRYNISFKSGIRRKPLEALAQNDEMTSKNTNSHSLDKEVQNSNELEQSITGLYDIRYKVPKLQLRTHPKSVTCVNKKLPETNNSTDSIQLQAFRKITPKNRV